MEKIKSFNKQLRFYNVLSLTLAVLVIVITIVFVVLMSISLFGVDVCDAKPGEAMLLILIMFGVIIKLRRHLHKQIIASLAKVYRKQLEFLAVFIPFATICWVGIMYVLSPYTGMYNCIVGLLTGVSFVLFLALTRKS